MYQSFQSFQSFLAFLFACLTFYTVAKVFGLGHLFDPLRDLWKHLNKAGRVLATVSVVFLAGYAISKERGMRYTESTLPNWFIALNYNATDTDGDGIPDCWERWTRTNPLVADADQDRDGDGVNNFGEFWNQCDPLMKDTDGDGYSDKLEIEGKTVGKTWFDPIVRASYEYNDPDCDTNGVPDRWEGLGYVYGYTDANGDGLPDGVQFPESGNGTFDVEVIVSTTRAALLSWGTSTNEAIVLPPCSCLPVRLRLYGYADTDVRLSCGTAGDGSEGLWYGRLVIRWPEGSGQETEADRIRIESDAVIECEAMEVSFRGEVQTTQTRSSGDDVPTSITSPFRRKWLYLGEFNDSACWEHCPGGEAILTTTYTNIAPPFAWYVNDNPVPNATGDTLDADAIREFCGGATPIEVRCEWTNSVQHRFILVMASATVNSLGHCQPGSTNIIGVASTSTHSHTNATDHLPEVTPESITQYTEYCPPATNLTVKAGWTHNTAVLWIRNLIRIVTGNPEDDETDHCIGLIWSEGGSISLYDYLADCCKPFADKFTYYVNGSQCEGTLEFGDEPEEFHPTVFHVELRDEDGVETLDRMWVVVNAIKSRNNFNEWYGDNVTDTSWVATLPRPYAQLSFSTNWLWGVTVVDPEPSAPNLWNPPKPLSSFLHHDAKWEMRSPENAGGHGNQACYDANGRLNRNGISGGTADYSAGELSNFRKHVPDDVDPFLNAVHLDGNPGDTTTLNNLSRPCLYQGDNIGKYIECRPIVQPEGE